MYKYYVDSPWLTLSISRRLGSRSRPQREGRDRGDQLAVGAGGGGGTGAGRPGRWGRARRRSSWGRHQLTPGNLGRLRVVSMSMQANNANGNLNIYYVLLKNQLAFLH